MSVSSSSPNKIREKVLDNVILNEAIVNKLQSAADILRTMRHVNRSATARYTTAVKEGMQYTPPSQLLLKEEMGATPKILNQMVSYMKLLFNSKTTLEWENKLSKIITPKMYTSESKEFRITPNLVIASWNADEFEIQYDSHKSHNPLFTSFRIYCDLFKSKEHISLNSIEVTIQMTLMRKRIPLLRKHVIAAIAHVKAITSALPENHPAIPVYIKSSSERLAIRNAYFEGTSSPLENDRIERHYFPNDPYTAYDKETMTIAENLLKDAWTKNAEKLNITLPDIRKLKLRGKL